MLIGKDVIISFLVKKKNKPDKKNLIPGKSAILGQKIVRLYKLFFLFCKVKSAKSYTKIIFTIFYKRQTNKQKNSGQMGPFGLKNSMSSQLWICFKDFFENFEQWKWARDKWKFYLFIYLFILSYSRLEKWTILINFY